MNDARREFMTPIGCVLILSVGCGRPSGLPPGHQSSGRAPGAHEPCVYRENGFRCCVDPPKQLAVPDPDLSFRSVPPNFLFIVEVRINESGLVTEDCMLRGIQADADEIVLATVRSWKFEPPRLPTPVEWRGRRWEAGDAVPIFMTVTVRTPKR